MKTRTVASIIQPLAEGLPPEPAVAMEDKIGHAIELMLKHNAKRVAVMRNGRVIGMIRLEDAFLKLGLQSAPKRPPVV
ncbi:MAG: CBS domain-containing protein [Desulfobacterales bacterium]|nr:MAG: CBS domain-containing protein [Desulfobacterales bacterium]